MFADKLTSRHAVLAATVSVAIVTTVLVASPKRVKWGRPLLWLLIAASGAAGQWALTGVVALAYLAIEYRHRVKSRDEAFATGAPFEQREDAPWTVAGTVLGTKRMATVDATGDVREAVAMSPPELVAAAQTNVVPSNDGADV